MGGPRRALGAWIVRRLVRPSLSPDHALATRRRRTDALARLLPPRRGVRVEREHLGGLPGEWLLPTGAEPDAAGLYVHGGGFVLGSPRSHRAVAAALASAAGMDFFVPDYRLAPESPFPAARDDVLAAWRDLMARSHVRRAVIAGDSAGGNLAVAAAVALASAGGPGPAALALFSPFLDLTLAGLDAAGEDALLPRAFLRESAAAYRGGRAADDPEVSPLFARLDGLPPTFVAVDAGEVLAGDARALADRAPDRVTLRQAQGLWHAWPLFAGLVPEADATVRDAAGFLVRHARPENEAAGVL